MLLNGKIVTLCTITYRICIDTEGAKYKNPDKVRKFADDKFKVSMKKYESEDGVTESYM